MTLIKLWPVALLIIGLAASAGAAQYQLTTQDKRLTHIENNNSDLKQGQAQIDERTRTMREEQRLIRQDIKEILQELRRPRTGFPQ